MTHGIIAQKQAKMSQKKLFIPINNINNKQPLKIDCERIVRSNGHVFQSANRECYGPHHQRGFGKQPGKTCKMIEPQSSIRPPVIRHSILSWLSKCLNAFVGILPAALSRRSPLRLRQRWQPICLATASNHFVL